MRTSGAALGGLAFGGAVIGAEAGKASADQQCECEQNCCKYPNGIPAQQYAYFGKLPPITTWGLDSQRTVIGTRIEKDEMRITFLGSAVPPVRRAQQEMNVFVEVGWDLIKQCPMDQFIFDCGSGVCSN